MRNRIELFPPDGKGPGITVSSSQVAYFESLGWKQRTANVPATGKPKASKKRTAKKAN